MRVVYVRDMSSFCQWMASGNHGLYGLAVLKLVEVAVSRGTAFAMGPFLEGNLVPVNERKSDNVTRSDAQVSAKKLKLLCPMEELVLIKW